MKLKGHRMQVFETDIADIKLLRPARHVDSRGFFSEVFKERELCEQGIDVRFVQDNHSLSAGKGVIRGLHFQIPPFAQAKLLRVTAGSIFDVAVDIRWNSLTFGRHIAVTLSAADWNQIFIPEGFAHGYCTLDPNTEVIYKVNDYYSPEHDRGLLWSDPALGIAWPVSAEEALISDKDRSHPFCLSCRDIFLINRPAAAKADCNERNNSRRRLRYSALSGYPGGQQAAPAGLRQADDLLSADGSDAGWHPRDPSHYDADGSAAV